MKLTQQGEYLSSLVEENQSAKFVTAREYYCFLMQVRKGLFNILLFGGRLFQQWVVDMYIKIESMRLDWYSSPANQKLIRAELYQVRQMCSLHNYFSIYYIYVIYIYMCVCVIIKKSLKMSSRKLYQEKQRL
jgi:hypothetical protein